MAELTRGKNLIASFITEMELRSWPSLTTNDIRLVNKLLSNCRVLGSNDEIKEKAIEIGRSTKLKLPDSIVCATSIFFGIPLLFADNDFKRVKDKDLLLINV